MKALTIIPRASNSASLREVSEPDPADGAILCEMLAIGICGTDRELMSGQYGEAPGGSEFLIIGHESLGKVIEAPKDSGFQKGDLVVGIVRRPDPVPCRCCAAGEWDMCQNGQYTERGIFKRHGFCSEKFRIEPEFAIKVDPQLKEAAVLLEPCSIVSKAWEQCERIFARSVFKPRDVLITGAGPVGLLAAMIGVQNGYEVHVLDVVEMGLKPELVKKLGAQYHSNIENLFSSKKGFDLTIECTGAASLVAKLMSSVAPDGILCLTGVSSGGRKIGIDIGTLNRGIVLENEVIFGSVNANRRHFERAAKALAAADCDWLDQLISRRVPLSKWHEAIDRRNDDVKVALIPG